MEKKILVVEAEQNLRRLYARELSEEGYKVWVVPSGEAAVQLLEAVGPDCVVTDLMLPGMDGVELIARILERDSSVPVIVNSACYMPAHDFLGWGAFAHVLKASDLAPLKAQIAEAISVPEMAAT